MATLTTIATTLGLKTYTETGRIKLEATRAGEVLKAFAALGCDCQRDGRWSWVCYRQDGAVAGFVLDCGNGFAYGFTSTP